MDKSVGKLLGIYNKSLYLSGMRSPNKILITVEKRFNDEVDFNGGKLWVDPTYRPEWNAIPHGEVVAVPENPPSISEDFVCNVKVGDKLYFNYLVVTDDNNRLLVDGKEYWMVDYYHALALVRDGKVIPVGEHILIEPIIEEMKNDFIIIPDSVKKVVKTEGKVFASNDTEIPVGAHVGFEDRGMFENEIEGNKLFVMFNSNILWKKN